MSKEFDPSQTPDPSIEQFAENLGQLFDREHRLPPPPKPLSDEMRSMLDSARHSTHFHVSIDYEPQPRPEPTLDEKIESANRNVDYGKALERRERKDSRSRLNFGTEFHIAISFDIGVSEYTPESSKPDTEVGLRNRSNLYQYLQHRGMVLVDDTGRDPYQGTRTIRDKGSLMLPKEIEHADFFEFEDEVRKHYPFDIKETRLVRLLQERAGNEVGSTESFASDPRSMMALIDQLSMDERFERLFDVARDISAARKEKPRATMEDEVVTSPAKPEKEQAPEVILKTSPTLPNEPIFYFSDKNPLTNQRSSEIRINLENAQKLFIKNESLKFDPKTKD